MCARRQVIKILLNEVATYADIFARPMTVELQLDDFEGERKCPTYEQLLNATGSLNGGPISVSFFNVDRDCCALAPSTFYPPPSPPPYPP
eukprot:323370-Chlamydomonas_euryale.AAC.1